MGHELHSIAYTNTNIFLLHDPSRGWDLHNLGVLNSNLPLVMDDTSPFISSLDDDFSTGYLEDALLEFADRSKRRRLLLYSEDQTNFSNHLAKRYWEMPGNLSCVSEEPIISPSMSSISEEMNGIVDMKTPEEEVSVLDSSSSSHNKDLAKTKSIFGKDSLLSKSFKSPCFGDHEEEKRNKKRIITRVVYPFALVKPGGSEGDMTINDINERILMPPTRPLRHPVGDFACRPCISAHGTTGLSGKTVVALTRIHTRGRGTITIIRTKG